MRLNDSIGEVKPHQKKEGKVGSKSYFPLWSNLKLVNLFHC